MKLGACHLWGDSLEAFRSDLRLAAELGFGIAAIGDDQYHKRHDPVSCVAIISILAKARSRAQHMPTA